jgi:orotate phosphoribosyltransferase
MDFLGEVSLIGTTAQRRRILAHPFDPRYRALDVKRLREAVSKLAVVIDTGAVDYVPGFPVGGIVPSLAFAELIDRPLIASMLLEPDQPGAIPVEEPHSVVGRVRYVQGLRPGDHVVIIEDEGTTGRTALNAVRAVHAAGVGVSDVGALLVVDHPSVWERFAAAGVALHAGVKPPPAYGDAIVGPAA